MPLEMMKKGIVTVFLGLIYACHPEGQTPISVGELFMLSLKESAYNLEYLDINHIRTIDEFELVYQQKSEKDEGVKFLIPYDFKEKKIIASQAGQASIPVFGVSLPCLLGCCITGNVKIEVGDNHQYTIEEEVLDRKSLKKWIGLQILNYGQDPTLSDNPNQAVFKFIFDTHQPLSDANLLFYELIEVYEEFLRERAIAEQKDITLLRDRYPLNIQLASRRASVDEPEMLDRFMKDLEIEQEKDK
jgi:hypothetical protein